MTRGGEELAKPRGSTNKTATNESESKPGVKMVVVPEPCKELSRRQLFVVGIIPY